MKGKRSLMLVGSLCLALILALMMVGACSPTETETTPTTTPVKKYEWRFGAAFARPLENETNEIFVDLVDVYSDGMMEVVYYPDGVLGSHTELFHAVQEGSVEIGAIYPYSSVVPGGFIQGMPWAMNSYDQAVVAYSPDDGIIWQLQTKAWDEVGFKLLFIAVEGGYGFANNVRPLRTPEDFRNLKMRVSGSQQGVMAYENMSEGTGMTLEVIPWADLYNALERGVVDAVWDAWTPLLEERHAEVLAYYTPLDAWMSFNNNAVNKEAWEALPADLQDAIWDAGRVAEIYSYEVHRRADSQNQKLVAEAGVEVYYLTEQERAVFQELTKVEEIWEATATPWLEAAYPGQNMAKKVQDELARIASEY